MSDDCRLDALTTEFTGGEWGVVEMISSTPPRVTVESYDESCGNCLVSVTESCCANADARLIANSKKLLALVFEVLPWCSASYDIDVLPDDPCTNIPTFISTDHMGKIHVCAEHKDQIRPWSTAHGWRPYEVGRRAERVIDKIRGGN